MNKLLLFIIILICSIDSYSQIIGERIEENRIYEFINSLYQIDKPESIRSNTRLLLKEPAMESIQKLIPSRLGDSIFSKDDIEYFERQISNSEKFTWTQDLMNMKLFATLDLRKYFKDRRGWKKFHRKFGNKCLREFSMPIFTMDGQYCIFYWNRICNYLDSRGNVSIYKKVDGKWKPIKALLETVS